MTRSCVLLCTILFLAAPASAQQERRAGGDEARTVQARDVVVLLDTKASVQGASLDDVLGRMLSFDRDHDSKVVTAELPERMRSLVARGDTDGDAALDAAEIRRLAEAPVTSGVASRGYGFADEFGPTSLSWRGRIEGVIDDLRLDTARTARAYATISSVVDTREAQARAAFLEEMAAVLTPKRQAQFTATLDKVLQTRRATRASRMVLSFSEIISEYNLSPEQRVRAFAANDRFESRLQMGDEEWAALSDTLERTLDTEEAADFRAALARRPVIQRPGLVFDGLVFDQAIQGLRKVVSVDDVVTSSDVVKQP
jgi:hypothetical protein